MNPDQFKGYSISWTIPANNPRGFENVTISHVPAKVKLAEELIEKHLKTENFAEADAVIARIKLSL